MFSLKNICLITLIISFWGYSCSRDKDFQTSETGFITAPDSAKIYYKVTGQGQDTLLIVHGGPGAGIHSFYYSVMPLAENFTLIFFDQRGGGKSTLPEDTTKLKPEYFVEDLEAVRDFFDLKKMDVIAHSFGSILLAEYALKYPNHLHRVVLHGSTGPIRSEMAKYYQEMSKKMTPISDTTLTNRASKLLSELLAGTANDPVAACIEYEQLSKKIARARSEPINYEDTTCDADANAVRYYYRYTAQLAPHYFGEWNYTNKLDNLKSPILVIYGMDDSLGIPPQQSWINITPNSRLLLVPDARKGAISDNPDFVFPAIDTFFEGNWPEESE